MGFRKFGFVVLVLAMCIGQLFAQEVLHGRVTDMSGEAIPFANILVVETEKGTSANDAGEFILAVGSKPSYTIRVSAIGYQAHQREVQIGHEEEVHIKLAASSLQLQQVVITGTMKEVYLKDSPVKVEVISSAFLKTNPTNSVIEALQTVNGVQEQINCGVCGTNDIHINGMEGPYTLVLIDGMPIMSALASVYGFNGIPTSLVDRIEIIKGPSSTLYGTEAVGGVINIITKRPEDLPSLSFNTFYTSHHESNTDLSYTQQLGDKLTTTLSGTFYRNQYRMDFNDDNFTDIPLNNRLSLFNRWSLSRPNQRKADVAIRYYNEDRFGGEMDWQRKHKGDTAVYGEFINTERIEVIGSYQMPGSMEALRVDYSFNAHAQDSYYGTTHYMATQSIYFANLIWNESFGKHDILTGATVRLEDYEDNSLANTSYHTFIPGLFVQDEWSALKTTKILTGVRFDYHKAHGLIVSPRLNIKQKLGEYSTLRLNVGTGFRRVNLFTEDHAALTGSRTVQIVADLQPEQSINTNLNFNHIFSWGSSTGTIDMDAFYTRFSNKIIPDYETDPNLIIYDNLSGHGITQGLAFNYQQEFLFPLRVAVGGTYQDVYEIAEENGAKVKRAQVFSPKFSGTYSLGYSFHMIGLSVDYTGKIMGPQHLPTYEAPFEREDQSPWYVIQNVQITKKFKSKFEVYAGAKNLGNWTQESPLINPEQPFSDSFDTSYAWGPLQTRRFYLGLRYTFD